MLSLTAAWKAGSWIDRFVMVFSVAGFSIPVFVFAYVIGQTLYLSIKGSSIKMKHSLFV